MKKKFKEFTFLGFNMELISMFYGIFLFFWGLLITFTSDSQSYTSLIPSLFGLPIFILSILAIKIPKKKKLLMHIVVTIGLLIFVGGLDFTRSLINIDNLFDNFWADISKLMMMFTGLFFVILCIQSFIYVRKNKSE
jgi:hypothetical protein